MSYAALTREDRNPVKRWLQARRLADAVALVEPARAQRIVDYGGGDGAATARLAARFPDAEIVCFEPAPFLRAEAEAQLAAVPQARVVADEGELPDGWAQTALCLEVLEHLPEAETARALETLARVLAPGGVLVLGVPLEIGPMALAKGMFRRGRRPGDFDAAWGNIWAAARGRPPIGRPVEPIAAGRAYHPHHLGFDHRRLLTQLAPRFRVVRRTGSPFGRLLPPANAELYIVAVKEDR